LDHQRKSWLGLQKQRISQSFFTRPSQSRYSSVCVPARPFPRTPTFGLAAKPLLACRHRRRAVHAACRSCESAGSPSSPSVRRDRHEAATRGKRWDWEKRILEQNSLAQHWARDWRALALTQVHYGSRRPSDSTARTARHLAPCTRPPSPQASSFNHAHPTLSVRAQSGCFARGAPCLGRAFSLAGGRNVQTCKAAYFGDHHGSLRPAPAWVPRALGTRCVEHCRCNGWRNTSVQPVHCQPPRAR